MGDTLACLSLLPSNGLICNLVAKAALLGNRRPASHPLSFVIFRLLYFVNISMQSYLKRCCKVLDDFDKSLILPALFWAGNPPENFWVSFSKHIQVLVRVIPFAFLMKPLFCRRITNHGTVCLHLQLMLPSLVAIMIRSRRHPLDHCCRGK